MTLTLELLLTWDPAPLQTAADNLVTDRRTLIDLQDELDGGRPPSDWEGDDAVAAGAAYLDLRERLNDYVAPLSGVIGALDDAAAIINTSITDISRVKQLITNNGWMLSTCGLTVTVNDPEGDADAETLNYHARLIADALAAADQADSDLNLTLSAAAWGGFDGGDGTLTEAALPSRLNGQRVEQRFEDMSDEELVDYAIANPEELDTYDELLTPRQQDLIGEAMAAEMEGYTVNNNDLSGPYPTQQEIDDHNELLNTLGTNPRIASSMLETLGPNGYAAAQASLLRYEGDVSPESLETASAAWNQLLPTASSELPQSWVDSIGETGEQYFLTPGGSVRGWELMGPALGQEGYDTDFLVTAGDQLLAYDQEVVQPGGVQESWTDDPVSDLMLGISYNPEAAQRLLDPAANTYLDSLLARQWQPYLMDPNEPLGVDNFGAALNAAVPEELDPRTTRILEGIVASSGAPDRSFDPLLAPVMADVIEPHMQEVFDTYTAEQTSQELVREESDGASFDSDHLTSFLEQIGRDDEAFTVVNSAATDYATEQYELYYAGEGTESGSYDPAEFPEEVAQDGNTYVTQPWSSVMSSLGQGHLDAVYEEATANDEAEGQYYDNLANVGSFAAGTAVSFLPTGPVGGIAVSGAVEVLAAPIIDHFRPDPTAPAETQAANASLAYTATNQVLTAEVAVYESIPVDALPPELVVDGERIPVSEWDEEQAQLWLESEYSVREAILAEYEDNIDQPVAGNGEGP